MHVDNTRDYMNFVFYIIYRLDCDNMPLPENVLAPWTKS